MTSAWRSIGRIDYAPVTHVALSPWFGMDRLAVAATSVGAFVTRDGGAIWTRTGAAMVGPLVSGLAPGRDGNLLMSSPAGLRFSRDWGDTWHALDCPDPVTAVACDDGGAFVAIDVKGQTWRVRLDPPCLVAMGMIPDTPFALSAARGGLHALGDCLWRSADGGSSWEQVEAPGGDDSFADLTAAADRCLLLTANSEELISIRSDAVTRLTMPSEQGAVRTLAASSNGSIIAIGGDASILVSTDGGDRWTCHVIESPVVSIAAGGGSTILAGLEDGTLVMSGDRGKSWSESRLTGGTMVAGLVARSGSLLATTVEGIDLVAGNGGRFDQWRMYDQVSRDPRQEEVLPGVDGEVMARSYAPDGLLDAVGTRGPDGVCAVWIHDGAGQWRKPISHPESARVVALICGDGPNSLFAGIGDSVYRPSRIGGGMFVRELIDSGRVREVLAIHLASAGDSGPVVMVLTDAGFYRSDDEGLSWVAMGVPDGPPVTAFALAVTDEGGCEVIAAQAGGALVSCRLR